MTQPEDMPRERASDVPEGAEVRADGSYVTPADSLTDEQKAQLLPPQQSEEEAKRELEQLEAAERAENDRQQRELASQDQVQRELGTDTGQVAQ